MAAESNPQEAIFQSLQQRGYSPEQSAALVGHMVQESGLNPNAYNANEGAHGLLQWRGDRWTGLQSFAASRGTSPNDLNTQLDYIRQEMGGPEAKSSSGFLAASDLPSASAALKNYIRFGDNSAGTRLKNAQAVFGRGGASPSQSVPAFAQPPQQTAALPAFPWSPDVAGQPAQAQSAAVGGLVGGIDQSAIPAMRAVPTPQAAQLPIAQAPQPQAPPQRPPINQQQLLALAPALRGFLFRG